MSAKKRKIGTVHLQKKDCELFNEPQNAKLTTFSHTQNMTALQYMYCFLSQLPWVLKVVQIAVYGKRMRNVEKKGRARTSKL